MSNALLYCCKNNSNALIAGITNNSNALLNAIQSITNNSNAIENIEDLVTTNSTEIVNGLRANSNALLYCCRNNSNALIAGITNNSNAILNIDQELINQTSDAINGFDDQEIINNSNAINYGLKNLSNALLYCCKNNSNALIYGITNNSNAIVAIDMMTDDLQVQNSHTIINIQRQITNNDNAFEYGTKNLSNALLYCCKNNSNALIYGITNNSNAILNIDNPGDIILTTNTFQENDIYLRKVGTPSRTIIVPSSADSVVEFDVGKNTIRFANDDGLINVADGKTLILKNVMLVDFSPSSVELNSSGNIIFGEGVHIKIAPNESDLIGKSIDLVYTWTFQGSDDPTMTGTPMVIDGRGHELNLASENSLSVLGSATLMIENINLKGVGYTDGSSGQHNIRCVDRLSTICFRETDLLLTNDYTFTNGYMQFLADVVVRGRDHTFTYASDREGVVQSQAVLMFDHDVTFSYDPVLDPKKTIFQLEDADAALYFRGSTLHTTHTGLRFDNGHVFVDDKVTFTSEARNDAEAIEISDSIDFKVLSGANLEVFGRLVFDS